MIEALQFVCHECGSPVERIQEINEPENMLTGVRIDVYQCSNEPCKRRAVIVYEPTGGLTETQQTWVEKEVMRTGSFFPSDFRGGGFGGGRDW